MKIFNKKNKSIFINIDNTIVTVKDKAQANLYANQLLKICYESTSIINKTKNPKIFFERYNLLIEETTSLAKLETFLKFKGTLPSIQLENLKIKKEQETNSMIARCFEDLNNKISELKTDKAKITNIQKTYDDLRNFEQEMTANNIELYTKYYENLINNF